MPYVIERWPGGMLTNFPTIRKAVKKMANIDKLIADGTYDKLSKRENLQIRRKREKLEKNLGSIADLTRLPSALFVVDVLKEIVLNTRHSHSMSSIQTTTLVATMLQLLLVMQLTLSTTSLVVSSLRRSLSTRMQLMQTSVLLQSFADKQQRILLQKKQPSVETKS